MAPLKSDENHLQFRKLVRFVKSNRYVIGVVVAFVVGTLIGQGALFQWASMSAATATTERERTELETNLISQLFSYERDIHKLVPEYVSQRDDAEARKIHSKELAYQATRYQLSGLFVSYNRLEAKLSQLERRGALFLLPSQLIPPRAPVMKSVTADVPEAVESRIENGEAHVSVNATSAILLEFEQPRDDVESDVSKQLSLVFDQHDAGFRHAYYLNACKLDSARFCTALAEILTAGKIHEVLTTESRELFGKGCALGDSVGCELLGFNAFHLRSYSSALSWLEKACLLSSANACGFSGTLYASDLLGAAGKNMQLARRRLTSGCDLQSPRSCYYLALLLVSSLVERDEVESRERLQAACSLGLDEGCLSLRAFAKFAACSPEAIHSLDGQDGATLSMKCLQPRSRKPTSRNVSSENSRLEVEV
jgi:hypothetical protein